MEKMKIKITAVGVVNKPRPTPPDQTPEAKK